MKFGDDWFFFFHRLCGKLCPAWMYQHIVLSLADRSKDFFLLLHWRIGKYGRFCSFRLLIPCARHKSGVIITSKLFIKISFGLHTFKSIGQLGKSSLKVFSCNTCHGFCQQFSNGPSLEICWKKSNNGFSSA